MTKQITIIEPADTFIGKGEVRNFTFTKIKTAQDGYIYKVETGAAIHYEVFKKKVIAKLIDFDTRTYSDTLFKVQYPKANGFGVWAWTATDMSKAEERLESFKEVKND